MSLDVLTLAQTPIVWLLSYFVRHRRASRLRHAVTNAPWRLDGASKNGCSIVADSFDVGFQGARGVSRFRNDIHHTYGIPVYMSGEQPVWCSVSSGIPRRAPDSQTAARIE